MINKISTISAYRQHIAATTSGGGILANDAPRHSARFTLSVPTPQTSARVAHRIARIIDDRIRKALAASSQGGHRVRHFAATRISKAQTSAA
jgi:hypothetical protein